MQGWIKLHRKILDNELWNDVSTFRLFTLLLLKAAHRDGVKINGVELKQGQYIRSYRKLAEDLSYKEGRGLKQYSTGTIKRCFAKLIQNGMVTVHETELGTLVTILNYASYQDSEGNESETRNGTMNEVETKSKRAQNNNKNEEELKNSSTRAKVFQIYQTHFGMPSVNTSERLHYWIDDLGEDLVIEAMRLSYKQGKLFWGFVEGVLKNWSSKGYRTIFDIDASERKSFNQQPKDNISILHEHARKNGISL